MSITTRKACTDDRDFCRSAHHAAYRDVVLSQFGFWDEVRQDEFFNAKWDTGHLQVLLRDGEPCGFTAIAEDNGHVFVSELVVHPAYQQQGIGTEFLSSVLERAAESGTVVRLQVLHQNRAVNLYRKLGFIEQDRSETHIKLEWKEEDENH